MTYLVRFCSERNFLTDDNSFVLLQCALWGFNGCDTSWGNPYRAVHVDMLHQTDLGVFPVICTAVVQAAEAGGNGKASKLIERNLMRMKAGCRWPDLRIPGTEHGGYFTTESRSKFAAFEHRAIMQASFSRSIVC